MKNYNYTANDYNFEEHSFTIVDVILFILYLMLLGKFLESFEEYLRRPRNDDDDDDYGPDLFDWIMFFD